jgi:hypothetical protein
MAIKIRNYPLRISKCGIDAFGVLADDLEVWETSIISGSFLGTFLTIGQAILQVVASWLLLPFGTHGGTKP